MKSTLTLALTAALALGSVAPVFAQSGNSSVYGTDCPAPATGSDVSGVDPAGDAKAPGSDAPCVPAAGSAGASGSDTTGSTSTTPGNDATGTSNGSSGSSN